MLVSQSPTPGDYSSDAEPEPRPAEADPSSHAVAGQILVEKLEKVCDQILETELPEHSPGRGDTNSPKHKHRYMNSWTERQMKLLRRLDQIEAALNAFDQAQILDTMLQMSNVSTS